MATGNLIGITAPFEGSDRDFCLRSFLSQLRHRLGPPDPTRVAYPHEAIRIAGAPAYHVSNFMARLRSIFTP
jgi:hypothetical protein